MSYVLLGISMIYIQLYMYLRILKSTRKPSCQQEKGVPGLVKAFMIAAFGPVCLFKQNLMICWWGINLQACNSLSILISFSVMEHKRIHLDID